MKAASVRIGCSGWQYRHWKGNFYPAEVPGTSWLSHYVSVFDTVELNNSFYRLPEAATFARWREAVPRRFLFAVKASRFLTHMKKLKDPDEPLDRFFSNAEALGAALGPVLYQLPPRWPADAPRLETFLRALRPYRKHRHVLEFREPSWYAPAILALLERHGVGLCLHDMRGSASPRQLTAPFVYVRFHGVERYGGRYPDDLLDDWSRWLGEQRDREHAVYAYFNNDIGGHAPRDALRLRMRLTGS